MFANLGLIGKLEGPCGHFIIIVYFVISDFVIESFIVLMRF